MDQWEGALLELGGTVRRWPAGAVLFHEGDRADRMVWLRAGRIKVTRCTAAGNEVLLAILGPGELLGELPVADQGRGVSATALEPVTALSVSSAALAGLLRTRPALVVALLRAFGRRLRDAEDKLVEQSTFDTLGRVTRRLVELADRFGVRSPAGTRIGLRLSQDELAGWAGASRIATAKALRVLRDRGWIQTGRREIVVRDLDALRRRADAC